MDAERWQRLSPLLDELLELAPEQRESRLSQLQADDPEAAGQLRELLALEDDSEDFMAAPLVQPDPGGWHADAHAGPYRLLRPLGEGGMGQVWLAERADGLYRRQVALKLLHPGYADPGLRQRFNREREILARLEHPHIARLLDAGFGENGQPYLVLAYVEGEPISEYCRRLQLPLHERLRLFLQVCGAVSHAHANLVVHRDLKPSNILVDAQGQVRLLDFGIAKLLDTSGPLPEPTRNDMRAFTLHYAAPEQVRGEPVSTLTDVYSLGVVLYELLTGQKPYYLRRKGDADWERSILAVEVRPASLAVLRTGNASSPSPEARRLSRQLRGDLDNILLKALQKVPARRYASVEALELDLRRHLDGRPVHARPQGVGYRLQKYAQRHRWTLALGGSAAALLLMVTGLALLQARQARLEATRAQAMQDFVIGLFDRAGSVRRGETFDVRRLLALGEQKGERELAGQPLAHAELLGVIALLHIGLGDYRQALQLAERQQALLAGRNDVPDALQLEAVTQHGRVLRLLSRSPECIGTMQPLAELALSRQDRLPRQASAFFSQIGRCQRLLGERGQARLWFERALMLNRDVLADSVGMVENMTDIAAMEGDVGNTDAAIAGYRQALDLLLARVGGTHPMAVNLQRSLGVAYRDRGDADQAGQMMQQALDTARAVHGDRHPDTLAVRRLQAAILTDRGQLAQAEAELRAAHALTVELLGPDHRDTGLSWNSLGMLALERGQGAQALAALQRSVRIWQAPDSVTLLPYGLFNLGLALTTLGRHAEAATALRQARELRVAQLGADAPAVADTDRLLAATLAGQGEWTQAEALLRDALARAQAGYGAAHPRARALRLAWARSLGHAGQEARALAELDAQARMPGNGIEDRKLDWRARAYAAELRCRRHDGGGPELRSLQQEIAQALPQGGSLQREVAVLLHDCEATTTPGARLADAG